MATILGGVTLADPAFGREGYEYELVDVGTFHETADGGVTYHYTTSRGRHKVTWVGITAAQKNAIRARYLVKTQQQFSAPDNSGAVTVIVAPNTWRESYQEDGGGTARYWCELVLWEVAGTLIGQSTDSVAVAETVSASVS